MAASLSPAAFLPENMSGGWLALLVLIGWTGSALFTILDFALFSLDQDELEELKTRLPRSARRIARLRDDMGHTWFTLLSGLLGFNLIFALAMSEWVLRVTGFLAQSHHRVVAGAIAVLAVLLAGEIVPGLLAAPYFKTLAPWAARFVRVFSFLLYPLTAPPLLIVRLAALLAG